ncbi:MAG: phenylalanine--tRNA ligase subunit beta [Dehalococcoidia bacterium]|nr:phenylalanine--tRNA ligase subunit beta [Dehalococcoidia bacterium]
MKVPISWLKEYVDMTVPAEELARRLTMAGTEVSEVTAIGGWKSCYVGLVTGVERHPNADRLTLCAVDLGSETARVVCGAPNVAPGQKIAFAKVGAELFNTHSGKVEALKAARIRGVVSEGMICSELELGLGDDHEGILVLAEEAAPGMSLSDYLGDQILDLDVTPNRPDCLSMLGVAREAAALTGMTVREPDISYAEEGDGIDSIVSVEVQDPDLCPRYTASLVSGIAVGPSPRWLQDRLTKAGLRPINNVVDVTNYVMLEYNQPLHAFDFDTLKGKAVIVRRARAGETLTTLDGVQRRLSPSMLVIADAQDPVGLAGIIGGGNTEMTEGTTAVLLESANFDAVNNRRTSQGLKLPTEASIRFEKSLRADLAPLALRRATRLIQEVAGGTAAKGIVDIFPGRDTFSPPVVTLTAARLRKVLGVALPPGRVEEALLSLGFAVQREPSNDGEWQALHATVPYWRSDIEVEDDLVEEVARLVGYDEIPTKALSTSIPLSQPQPLRELRERIKDHLAGCGLQEVINYPLTNLEELEKVRAPDADGAVVRVANPMSSQQEFLRPTIVASVLSTLASNRPHLQGPVSVFEAGRVFLPRQGDLPEEREMVVGALSGPRSQPHWMSEGNALDFYDAKGVVERLLEDLGISASYEGGERGGGQDPALHPARNATIGAGDTVLGRVGELHPGVAESFGLSDTPVALFELDVERILEAMPEKGRRYEAVGRFPSAIRDVSVLVDAGVPSDRVQAAIARHPLVAGVVLFDVYSGENVAPGKRSLAYHVHFQAPDRTLTSEEVSRALKRVVGSLEREVGGELRE